MSSTQYLEFGDYFLKYSSDGVACVDSKSNTKWSTTYSMQAPFVDVCGTTAVIADQQGMQVYVFDEEGLKGQFQTKLPIQKARVATQGVVAVILADDDVTWVNFYDRAGGRYQRAGVYNGGSGEHHRCTRNSHYILRIDHRQKQKCRDRCREVKRTYPDAGRRVLRNGCSRSVY